MAAEKPTFVVVGAGAIGGFYGVLLHKAGYSVKFLVRDSARSTALRALLAERGWKLGCSAEPGWGAEIPAAAVSEVFTTDNSCLSTASYVFVATKRTENLPVHEMLTRQGVTCPVVFLQNGINICKPLGTTPYVALETVVNFNCVSDNEAGTLTLTQERPEASLILDGRVDQADLLAKILNETGVKAEAEKEFFQVQCGKLMVNLINAVNALSGETLLPMMKQAPYRQVLAGSVAEAQAVFAAAGVEPKVPTVSGGAFVFLLRSPQPLFMATIGRKLKSRAEGRTSMAQDLIAKRVPTEIDFLNGEICKLGKEHSVPTPVNDKIVALVKEAEVKNEGSPNISGADLLLQTGAAGGSCSIM